VGLRPIPFKRHINTPYRSDLGSCYDRAKRRRPDTPARHVPADGPRDRVYMPAAGTG